MTSGVVVVSKFTGVSVRVIELRDSALIIQSVRKGVDLSYTTARGLIRLLIVTKMREFFQN